MIASINHRYNTFWPRLLARIIDLLAFWPVLYLTSRMYWFFGGNLTFLFGLATILLGLGLSVWFHWSFGQSIGKMYMGIKVVHHDTEEKLEFKQVVLRETPYAIVPVLWILMTLLTGTFIPLELMIFGWVVGEAITALISPKQRSIHDQIAGTVVVRER